MSSTRRALLGHAIGATAALAVLSAAKAQIDEAHPDWRLITFCAKAHCVDVEAENYWGSVGHLKPRDPRYAEAYRHAEVLTLEYSTLHDQVIDLPAATDAGRRAKAELVLWHLREMGEDCEIARSLARDMLAMGAAA